VCVCVCVHSAPGFINVRYGLKTEFFPLLALDTAHCNQTGIKITSLSPKRRAEVQNVHFILSLSTVAVTRV